MIDEKPQRRVVCAALFDQELDMSICGPRHCDQTMWYQITAMGEEVIQRAKHMEQGFVDQWGRFMNREEAWKVAQEAGQIRGEPNIVGTLFSEDLY